MKVLHIIASVSKVRGGTSQAVLEMVRALKTSGICAEIITTNDSCTSTLNVPLNQKISYCDVPVYFFPRFSTSVHILQEFAISLPLATWLWYNLPRYDLVHIHALFSMPCTLAMIIARHRGIPYVVSPHGLLCQWSLQQSALKKQIYLRLIERSNLNHSAGLHLNSQLESDEISSLGLTISQFILPHGLHVPPLNSDAYQKVRKWLEVPLNEPIILFLSRLHPKKGLNILISALTQLQDYCFTCVIAGSGEPNYEAEIRYLITQSEMSDRIRMVGFIEGEQKDLLLQGSDIFVLPSYSENFGLAVLEALASGLPVVVTSEVALSTLVTQHQFGQVTDLEQDAIAHALTTCLKDPEAAKEMGQRARQFILEHYTWDKIATQLIDVYCSILSDRPNPAIENIQ